MGDILKDFAEPNRRHKKKSVIAKHSIYQNSKS